jgi:O-antigen/teichoic acid export membrane protein
MPLLSSVLARGELEKSKEIFLSFSKATVAIVILGASGIMSLGYPFIKVWIGVDIGDDAETVVIILTLYLLLPLINPLDSRVLTALNRHGILAIVHPMAAVANVLLSVALGYKMGVIGIALGSLLPSIVLFPIILKATCAATGIRISHYFEKCVTSAVGPAIVATLAMLFLRWTWGVESFLKILVIAIFGVTVFAVLFWTLGLNTAEKNMIHNLSNSILNRSNGRA